MSQLERVVLAICIVVIQVFHFWQFSNLMAPLTQGRQLFQKEGHTEARWPGFDDPAHHVVGSRGDAGHIALLSKGFLLLSFLLSPPFRCVCVPPPLSVLSPLSPCVACGVVLGLGRLGS